MSGRSVVNDKASAIARPMGAKILELLFLIRSSGHLQFHDALGLKEIEIRLIGSIGRTGPMPSLKIASSLGISKSQTSHATRSLTNAGIIQRERHRAPFVLTALGREKHVLTANISSAREQEITRGVDEQGVQFFNETLLQLMEHGEAWLADEQAKSAAKMQGFEPYLNTAAGDMSAPDAMIPSILKMAVLMQRATFLQWKREVGITQVNWITLSRVAEHGVLKFSDLVHLTARDKGQVSRTIANLIELDLLYRETSSGVRDAELEVTDKGAQLYLRTARLSNERDQLISRDLGAAKKERFEAIVERMVENASRMLREASKAT